MVDTRSKVLKEGEKGKHEVTDDPLRGYGDSPTQSFGENLMDSPSAQQFVTP